MSCGGTRFQCGINRFQKHSFTTDKPSNQELHNENEKRLSELLNIREQQNHLFTPNTANASKQHNISRETHYTSSKISILDDNLTNNDRIQSPIQPDSVNHIIYVNNTNANANTNANTNANGNENEKRLMDLIRLREYQDKTIFSNLF
jgi:hypothetical protein